MQKSFSDLEYAAKRVQAKLAHCHTAGQAPGAGHEAQT